RRLCYVAITRAEQFLYLTHAMKRRVYGEEMTSEPSQFLNEMPFELIEDLTRGHSWLSFARKSSTVENKQAVQALRGDSKSKTGFAGPKTYDSAESIAEFFRQRNEQLTWRAPQPPPGGMPQRRPPDAAPKLSTPTAAGEFPAGTHVQHPKYGRGLVLRREGTGDSAKLTVSFPGFGQKKLVEKYAGLTRA
ncbi:MAG: hypothetical protein WKF30_08545, partial [Pyrinomonadaceae bacterium]